MSNRVLNGLSQDKLYKVWHTMCRRCHNPKAWNFKTYGERGIQVCKEWRTDFVAFYDWANSHGYKDGLTLDRIDNNRNYEPSNCRWATKLEQARNKQNTEYITYNGITKPLVVWAEELSMKSDTLRKRIDRLGLSIEEALTRPIRQYHRS